MRPNALPGETGYDSPRLVHGTVRFELDPDYIVRRWRLWDGVCLESGQPEVVPSVALLAAGYLLDRDNMPGRILDWIQQFKPRYCGDCRDERSGLLGWRHHMASLLGLSPEHSELRLGDRRIESGFGELEQRVVFALPYLPASSGRNQGYAHISLTSKARVHALHLVSARMIRTGASTDAFRDRIVVIGASFTESGDIHATPLGELPGSMCLINAIYALLEYSQLHEPSFLVDLLLLLGLVLLLTFSQARLPDFRGFALSTATAAALLAPFSFLLFHRGLWLDFALPVTGVLVHHLWDALKDSFEVRRKPEGPKQ